MTTKRAATHMCIAARLLFVRKEVSTDSTPSLHPIRNDVRGFFFVRRTFFSRHAELCYDPPALDRLLYRASRRLLAMYGV
ncbi:MAG: hypothetical protein NNA21_05710 [Nitrospira sp.]|nr:hypothetical protein [Nitrospira sp.]MCP9460959.1 hypothetical protein [Nitrospira sp.]MCP9474533.1 hypothetical protein [Nitrospira sp.]